MNRNGRVFSSFSIIECTSFKIVIDKDINASASLLNYLNNLERPYVVFGDDKSTTCSFYNFALQILSIIRLNEPLPFDSQTFGLNDSTDIGIHLYKNE